MHLKKGICRKQTWLFLIQLHILRDRPEKAPWKRKTLVLREERQSSLLTGVSENGGIPGLGQNLFSWKFKENKRKVIWKCDRMCQNLGVKGDLGVLSGPLGKGAWYIFYSQWFVVRPTSRSLDKPCTHVEDSRDEQILYWVAQTFLPLPALGVMGSSPGLSSCLWALSLTGDKKDEQRHLSL